MRRDGGGWGNLLQVKQNCGILPPMSSITRNCTEAKQVDSSPHTLDEQSYGENSC